MSPSPATASSGDDVRLEDLDVAALGDRLVRQNEAINRMEAARLRTLVAFLAREVWRSDGYTGPARWLRDRCRMSINDAVRLVRTANGLGMLPSAREAFDKGEISRDHAQVLADTLKDLAPDRQEQGGIVESAEVAAEVDDELLSAAKKMDPELLGKLARDKKRKRDDHDHDRAARARMRHAKRRFRSWTEDGMYAFDGLLPRVEGEALEAALEAFRRPDPAETPTEMRRSFPQRNADALVNMARAAAGAEPEVQPASGRAQISVLLSWEALLASVGDGPLRDAANGAAEAQLNFTGEVPVEMIARLLCDSSIARIVTGPNSLPLDTGEATPTVPAGLRRAVIARDRHCRAPGCDRPSRWGEIHHVVWRRFGGKTKLGVLVLLCTKHHHYVHDLGWKLDLRADAACIWTAPDTGRSWVTRPGDPKAYPHDAGDGVPIVAHGSLRNSPDPRDGPEVRLMRSGSAYGAKRVRLPAPGGTRPGRPPKRRPMVQSGPRSDRACDGDRGRFVVGSLVRTRVGSVDGRGPPDG